MNWHSFFQAVGNAASHMTWPEVTAVGFSIIYVVLAARGNIWCWAAALISVSLYIYIFFQAKLYVESLLQVYYWIMAIYGWHQWRGNGNKNHNIAISTKPGVFHLTGIITCVILASITGYLFANYTDASLPYLDASTTVFSFFTTWMVAKKILENWLYWIVIDSVSIYMFLSRDLNLTALLFFGYTIIAIIGYRQWKRLYHA